jgi:hypothetical protein
MDGSKKERRLLWCDAEANCHRLSSESQVSEVVCKAKRAGMDTLIVDVKPLVGEVLYKSKHAPRLGTVGGKQYPLSFDLLAVMIEVGNAEGLKIHAAVNVFSEGHRQWKRGPAYSRPDWQVVMYEPIRTIDIGGSKVTVRVFDPWSVVDEPVIYTRKTGRMLIPHNGNQYISIIDNEVVEVVSGPSDSIDIPENGCILVLPPPYRLNSVPIGGCVKWGAEGVFRSSAESLIPTYGVFVNPVSSVREYELRIIEEVVSEYNIDGIVFDRMRYPNLYGDFSSISRDAFREWLGVELIRWPDDIFVFQGEPWKAPIPGRYYKEWLEWRAWQIYNFASEATTLVRSIRPDIEIGVYVGSWYNSYYEVGVNWGSCEYHPRYDWMTENYNKTGYAEMFDYICTGCYYSIPTREEARKCGLPEGATVEAGCELSQEAVGNACSVYGSLYLLEYQGKPEVFRRSIDIVRSTMDGIMLFDLVYLEEYGWWPILYDAFQADVLDV